MEIFQGILTGFAVAITPANLGYCLVGVLVGTLVGVLPGLGPVAAIALLLPTTFGISSASAVIMLAGIFYGAQYGGSTTSILANIPGEATSVMTCLDGYQMARQGRAGPALAIAALGSFVAGTLGVLALTLAAPPLARLAIRAGAPELTGLMLLGLVLVAYLSRAGGGRAIAMALVGLLLGAVGMEPISGFQRYTFGSLELLDGIGFLPVAMGLFGIGEVLSSFGRGAKRELVTETLGSLWPTRADLRASAGPTFRGGVLGFLCGLIPGPSVVIATVASYALERRLSRHPERFGTGAIEGVAGPESANNAAAAGSLVPLLTLGLPSSPPTAILLAALLLHGVTPGPLLMTRHPDVFWGVIASMYIGNLMLLVLNLPLVGLFVRILLVPAPILLPLIVLVSLIGAYSLANSLTDIFVMTLFGLLGYLLRKAAYDTTPLVIALVLGPMFETALRQALIMGHGSPLIFLTRPASALFMLAVAIVIALTVASPLGAPDTASSAAR